MKTLALALGLAVLALPACGDGTGPDITKTEFASSLDVDLATMTRTASGLYYKDLEVGSGDPVGSGQSVSVRYVGNLPDGYQFDANPEPQPLLVFTLGSGQVIDGFDEGVTGMRVDGRRQVIIPPELGYGNRARGNIPANSILVFTVDLVAAS